MIDILGFKEIVEKAYKDKIEKKILINLKKAIQDTKQFCMPNERYHTKYKLFSDNILIGLQIDKSINNFQLDYFIKIIAHYQMGMALHGYFIRGGLTIGSLYMDNDIIFGKALIDSHKLESKIAINPRIVLDDKVKKVLKKSICEDDSLPPRNSIQNKYVIIDSDGKLFIDYLHIIHNGKYCGMEYIKTHKELITKKLKLHKSKFDIFSKYIWSANYHNYFCKHNREFNKKNYLINNKSQNIDFKRFF